MARAIWSGAVSFGLVNVAVKAYTASRDHEVHFHQIQKGTGSRIKYKKVSEKTGREVDSDNIVLGYELSKGKVVTVDPDELDALRPQSTRTIDVSAFVPLDQIDPIYFERTYWLAPDGEAAARAYRLLVAAMEDEGRVGIGTVVMRRKEYLAAVRPLDGALALSTMRFADEVIDKSSVEEIPSRRTKPDAKELAMAKQIVDALASDFDPTQYKDTYTDEVRDIIERKAEGEEIEIEEAAETSAKVVDLLAALEASVEATKRGRASSRSSGRKAKASSTKRSAGSKRTSSHGDASRTRRKSA